MPREKFDHMAPLRPHFAVRRHSGAYYVLTGKKQHHSQIDNVLILLARPEGFEPPTPRFVVSKSIISDPITRYHKN